MSGSYVREGFRAKLTGLLAPLSFTYVESINAALAAKDLPPRWYTLEFLPADDSRISLGRPALFRESGSAMVLLFTEHQISDGPAITAAEQLRAELCNWFLSDETGQALRVLDAGPPTDLDGGDFRGAWYGLTVDLRYQFDRMA